MLKENFAAKARFCLPGYRSESYVDHDPTNSYVTSAFQDYIHVLQGIGADENPITEEAEISNTFFYGDFDFPIFMEQPTDSTEGHAMAKRVNKINESNYGSRGAPK